MSAVRSREVLRLNNDMEKKAKQNIQFGELLVYAGSNTGNVHLT